MPLETTINYQCFIIDHQLTKNEKVLQKKNKYPHNPPLPFLLKQNHPMHTFQRQDAPVHNKAVAHATKRVRLHWLKAGCDRLRMSTLAGWVHHLEDGPPPWIQ